MANQAGVLAISAVVGAIAGSAVTLLLGGAAPAPSTPPATASDPELARQVSELAKAIEDLRSDLAARPVVVSPEGGADLEAGTSSTEIRRTLHEVMPELTDAPNTVTLPSGVQRDLHATPPEDVAIFDAWWGDRDLRRKWILSPQSEFLERFGLPDSISAGNGIEVWNYFIEREDPRTKQKHRVQKKVQFSRGRLTRVD